MALRQAPKAAQFWMLKHVVKFVRLKVGLDLKRYPPHHTFPYGEFPWTTEKQKRAFFATGGFGGGIPGSRTGDLSRSWHTIYTFDALGGNINIVNDEPYMPFVQGEYQQEFHRITGWLTVGDFMLQIGNEVDEIMTDGWTRITDAIWHGTSAMEAVR